MLSLSLAVLAALSLAQPGSGQVESDPQAEGKFLGEIRQLTFAEEWAKAGEAYFSPDGTQIVFQAIPAGSESQHYRMYVRTYRDADSNLPNVTSSISPVGSANTCAWFHPREPGVILFGSTLVEPSEDNVPGYQRGSGRYRWAFPAEMRVVEYGKPTAAEAESGRDDVLKLLRVPHDWKDGFDADGNRFGWNSAPELYQSVDVVVDKPGYTAECSYSPDGRHILYAQVDEAKSNEIGRPDADLWVYDTQTEEHVALVEADGYDGGPFFSPDGKWICFRSDRKGDNLLQLFVAELVYDDAGRITGISREIQLTDNGHVNWAPFWHPSGEYLVYASSQVSHGNYEVFALGFDAAEPEKKNEPVRITYAPGFDGLPVFSADGKWMMWTAQRGEDRSTDGKASSQLWIAEWKGLGGE